MGLWDTEMWTEAVGMPSDWALCLGVESPCSCWEGGCGDGGGEEGGGIGGVTFEKRS